jgi:hypothetical protein
MTDASQSPTPKVALVLVSARALSTEPRQISVLYANTNPMALGASFSHMVDLAPSLPVFWVPPKSHTRRHAFYLCDDLLYLPGSIVLGRRREVSDLPCLLSRLALHAAYQILSIAATRSTQN